MSHLEFKSYEGVGKRNFETYGYSQSVRIGDYVHLSGQGGWDQLTGKYRETSAEGQVSVAFDNIKVALEEAGATFENVYKIRSYHVPILGNASVEAVSKQIARHIPTHKPLWTCVEVGALAEPEMKIEIEIEAHIPPSTKSV